MYMYKGALKAPLERVWPEADDSLQSLQLEAKSAPPAERA